MEPAAHSVKLPFRPPPIVLEDFKSSGDITHLAITIYRFLFSIGKWRTPVCPRHGQAGYLFFITPLGKDDTIVDRFHPKN